MRGNAVEEYEPENSQYECRCFACTGSGDNEEGGSGRSENGLQLIGIGFASGGLGQQLLEVWQMHAVQIRLEDQGLAE